MQMDSHMVPSLWSSLEQGEGVNYRLVATDKVAEHCDNFSHIAFHSDFYLMGVAGVDEQTPAAL